ncbi:MAG: DUF4185 domain-containing protein [Actinomycetes bacterium]
MVTPRPPQVEVEPWPEAEAMFRRDPRWLGGDDAHSVHLGEGRHLWLFGDTFLRPAADGGRAGSSFVHNTVGIQRGARPDEAALTYHWREADGGPAAVFEDDEPGVYLWPGNGLRVGLRVVLFSMRVRSRVFTPRGEDDPRVENLHNFELLGWSARLLEGADDDPAAWRTIPVRPPEHAGLVGIGGLLEVDDHVLAYCLSTPWTTPPVRLLRWPVAQVAAGDLSSPAWWDGRGWSPRREHAVDTGLRPLTEFTVHRDEALGMYVSTQLRDYAAGRIEFRCATHPGGPWSAPTVVQVPQGADPDAIAYAAKCHPHQVVEGGGVMLTYATNGTSLETVLERDDLYQPHVLRIRFRP